MFRLELLGREIKFELEFQFAETFNFVARSGSVDPSL